MNNLPEEILLRVFSDLDCKDLSRISSVCKRWRLLCSDNSLWANVRMLNRHSNNSQLKKLIRSKLGSFTHGITVLHLGSYGSGEGGESKPLPRLRLTITSDVMRLLASECPHLTELSLAYCDLVRSFPHCLPETLTEITLVSCHLPVVLSSPEQPPVHLSQLRRLSIYYAVSVTQWLLAQLCTATGLRCLELVNCPRLSVLSLGRIKDQFPKLESLALPGINLLASLGRRGVLNDATDLALLDLIQHLPELRLLNLSWVCGGDAGQPIVDRIMRPLFQSSTRLSCIACPSGLSLDVLEKIARLPSMRLVCCSNPPAVPDQSFGRLRFASLETYYRLHCAHFYRCGLDMFLTQQPLEYQATTF